jgi:predicted NAD/FAD-binding protein
MPKNKKAWCSWNSSLNLRILSNRQLLIGLINYKILKLIKIYFLTINPFFKIDQNKIFNEIDFTHPYYDENALQNQSNLKSIQNVNNTLFTGSYFGYGFHEDGIKSSIEMLKTIND